MTLLGWPTKWVNRAPWIGGLATLCALWIGGLRAVLGTYLTAPKSPVSGALAVLFKGQYIPL